MQQTVFPRARREPRGRARARASAASPPLPDPGARPSGRARRPGRARQGADRLRQDVRVRRCRSSSGPTPDDGAAVRARARPDARARRPGRRRARAARAAEGPARRRRLRRRPDREPGEARPRRARPRSPRPGRLQDLVERRLVSLDRVRILVLDEADRMLDMGFKPQVDRLVRRLPRERQTMLFSATLDGEVGELARAYTSSPVALRGEAPERGAQGEVEHTFVAVTRRGKARPADRGARARARARARLRADEARRRPAGAQAARAATSPAVALHGDMTQGQRERALGRFRSGAVTTLVATDVAARGLDLTDITHVINFDPPEDDKGYVHRVGRTGRAGRGGTRDHLRPARAAGRRRPGRREARPPRAVRGARACCPGRREARLHEPPRPPLTLVAASSGGSGSAWTTTRVFVALVSAT